MNKQITFEKKIVPLLRAFMVLPPPLFSRTHELPASQAGFRSSSPTLKVKLRRLFWPPFFSIWRAGSFSFQRAPSRSSKPANVRRTGLDERCKHGTDSLYNTDFQVRCLTVWQQCRGEKEPRAPSPSVILGADRLRDESRLQLGFLQRDP